MRSRIDAVRAFRLEEARVRVTRLRLIEICVAVVLTMAALLFIALTAWAEAGGVSVTEAWAWPTIGEGRTTGRLYDHSKNGDADVVLKAVKSPGAKHVECTKRR